MDQSDLKSLTLVLAGALIGFIVIFIPVQRFNPLPIGAITLLAVAFLFFGTGILQKYYHRFHLFLRRRSPFKVGILNDLGTDFSDNQIWSWADVSPGVWKERLEFFAVRSEVKIRVEMIKASDQLDRFAVVLNPYGGVYPEQDLRIFSTLNKFLDYVSEGGIFVNVADVPMYWAYSSKLHRRVDATPTVYVSAPTYDGLRITSLRPFELTPLMKELALRGIPADVGLQINLGVPTPGMNPAIFARRLVVKDPNVESFVNMPPIKVQDATGQTSSIDVSPLFSVRYGEGDFLISLIWINDKQHTNEAKDLVRDAVAAHTIAMIDLRFAKRSRA